MRRLIAPFLALLLAFAPAVAQTPLSTLGAGPGQVVSGGSTPTLVLGSAVAIKTNGFVGGTLTFSNLNGGTNFPSGAVVYVFVGNNQATTPLTSPQVGGNAVTQIAGATDANANCSVYRVTLGGAATDNFTVTNGNQLDALGVASVYMTNVTAAPSATAVQNFGANANPQTPSSAATVPATGFGVAFVWASGISTFTPPNNPTWANTTAAGGDINPPALSPLKQLSLAHTASAGSWTPTVTDAASQNLFGFSACMSVIAVGP